MNQQDRLSTITLKDKVVAHHISDGSELIPAEIQYKLSRLARSQGAVF